MPKGGIPMQKADGYLTIPKEMIAGFKNGDINNSHIFNCTRDHISGKWKLQRTSRCGNVEHGDVSKLSATNIKTCANDIRQEVTNIENRGQQTVCGQCVATLYADNN